jgi:hypothetical protein
MPSSDSARVLGRGSVRPTRLRLLTQCSLRVLVSLLYRLLSGAVSLHWMAFTSASAAASPSRSCSAVAPLTPGSGYVRIAMRFLLASTSSDRKGTEPPIAPRQPEAVPHVPHPLVQIGEKKLQLPVQVSRAR